MGIGYNIKKLRELKNYTQSYMAEKLKMINVQFQDQSTQANDWQWDAKGEPFSTEQNPYYTFADTGTYTVSLIAWLNDPACADTATVTIRVNPGIRIALPNIFTPKWRWSER